MSVEQNVSSRPEDHSTHRQMADSVGRMRCYDCGVWLDAASKPHSEGFIVIDTARFLADHPENAGVADAIKLARAYVGLYEQLEALRDAVEDHRDDGCTKCRDTLAKFDSNPAKKLNLGLQDDWLDSTEPTSVGRKVSNQDTRSD